MASKTRKNNGTEKSLKKIMMMIAAMAMTLAMALTMAAPAQAYDAYNLNGCDGGGSGLKVDIGVVYGNGNFITDVDIYDNPDNRHSWDWWIYRNGVEVRHGHEWGNFFGTYVIDNPTGPDTLKFRAANDARTINCTASLNL